MAIIKAPFNFVPLSEKVYFPNWADQISQDIPFEDGISGTIELKITAQTPIFVRNGHTKSDADDKNEDYKSFSKSPDGKYFIPGTSIKGAIRNVLEIMSFGKMSKQRFQNQSFGIRDLSKNADGTFYREKIKTENVHCGWLRLKDDVYCLKDCGLPWRISAKEIDSKLGTNFVEFVKNADNFRIDYNRTAKKKYELAEGKSLTNTFSEDEDTRSKLSVGNRQFVNFDEDGKEGSIVFTGQPGERKISGKTKSGKDTWRGKFFEFVFPSESIREVEVDKYVIKEFLSIHKNSPDYRDFRKQQLFDGEEIPVFFLYDEKGNVAAIGLSYMFKYPAFNTVYNAVRLDFLSDEKDMSECLFGCTNTDDSLKGRVSFTNAFVIGNYGLEPETKVILSEPNPSYYPLYLGDGQTWNSRKVELAGRKRYPIRTNIHSSTFGTDAMSSSMLPLSKGTEFVGKVVFHNLKPCELGAILSAILFHNEKDCYHSLGAGKPYGYGNVKVEVLNMEQEEIVSYLNSFESEMTSLCTDWKDTPTIQELFAMAKGIPKGRENEFAYMHMDNNRVKNEFLNGKDEYSRGTQLGTFSQILNHNVPQATYVGNVEVATQRQNVERLEALSKERHRKYVQLVEQAKTALDLSDFVCVRTLLSEAKDFTADYSEIDTISDSLRKIEYEIESEKQRLENEQEQQRIAEGKRQKLEAGLSFLLETYVNTGELKLKELSAGVKRVSKFIKQNAAYVLTESDMAAFHNWLTQIPAPTKKADKKEYEDFSSKTWKQISELVGEDTARQWFEEIINS